MILLALLTTPLISCAEELKISQTGLCDGLDPLVNEHAVTLQMEDVPAPVVISGANLIRGYDAGCGKEPL